MSEAKPDSTVLLSCPFCGSENKNGSEVIDPHGWLDGEGNFGPQCLACGATCESSEKWNTRHISREKEQQISSIIANHFIGRPDRRRSWSIAKKIVKVFTR